VNIIGHWLNVKQRSCQAMGSRWNSHCGTEERIIAKQISGESGCIGFG